MRNFPLGSNVSMRTHSRLIAPACRLYRLSSAALFTLLLAAASAAGQSQSPVAYNVSLADPAHHIVRVTMVLPPGADEQQIQLPAWNALYEVRDFSQYVLTVNAGSHPLVKVDKSTWAVSGAAQGATITYDIFADSPGPFGAQLNEHHAFFSLAEILMYPAGHTRDLECRVNFSQVPAAWHIAMPLHSLPTRPGEYQFTAASYDRLVDSPVEMGTFQQSDFQEGGATYHVVVDAEPGDYSMGALTEALRKIVAEETAWMNDRPFDEYTFIYHFPRGPAGGGMEHAYSTAIATSASRLKNDATAPASVSAHEFFHLWNVKRIRPQTLEPIDYSKEMYTRALWFSEGVTSTVGDYTMLHAGLMNREAYLRRLGELIGTLQERPAHRTQSAEESSLDTWFGKYAFYRQPERSIDYYNKGEILGVLLDLQMREATRGAKSLRDVFHFLNDNYAKQGRFFPDPGGVEEAAKTVTGADLSQFFRDYVAGTAEIPYNDFFATVGLALRTEIKLLPDTGFRVNRADGEPPVVISVEAGSGAAKAGLQPGDILDEVEGAGVAGDIAPYFAGFTAGDTVHIRIRREGKRRDLKLTIGSRQVRNYVIDTLPNATPEQVARREAWLAGK